MRSINHFIAQAILLLACILPAAAQGYDPNQGYGQQPGGYPQQGYQQFNGLPQTTPNYGYQDPNMQQQQYGGQPQQQYNQQQYSQQQYAQSQPQLQQQYAQYGQMPAPPTYYGQAQQSTAGGGWPASGGASQSDQQQTPGSFLNQGNNTPTASDLPDTGSSDDNSVSDQPSGGSKGGAMIKGAAGMLGKFVGGASKVAAPAASIYLMNKAAGGRMRFYAPAPMMPGMGGMGYNNPYMGVGMRRMMGGW
ncbi:MAG: hypothetical protein K2X93_09485 [Candidatus Obscuribacterales bacterium]|nr:hypothetical protein [Candidatus Obscuribacterales bacterium]